jgi:hypothetical protein
MMKDPVFVKQMKAMMGEKGVEEAAARAKSAFQEISNDPEKLAAMKSKMEKFMQGGEIRPDLSSGMRREARAAAGKEFGIASSPVVDRSIDGATNARLGYDALQESLKDPKAMADAVAMMKDPTMVAEMKRMMKDPAFRNQVSFPSLPHYVCGGRCDF